MTTLRLELIHYYGDVVYVKTDTDQNPGIIVGISLYAGHLYYIVSRNGEEELFNDFELSKSKDILLTSTN
jgi:hypothetical protein